MAKDAVSKRKDLLSGGLSRVVKKRIIKSMVWSVALYDAETWTIRKDDIRKIEAFEMWIWRKIERISWTEKITIYEEVLRRVGESRTMMMTIVRRKKNWIGRIIRGEGLLREVIEGKMVGKTGPGRPRIGMLNELLERDTYGNMKRRAEDRTGWRDWMPWTCQMAEH